MPTATTPLEIQLYAALRTIAAYSDPAVLRRIAEREYGLPPEEVLEMSYENVLATARNTVRGVRVRKATRTAAGAP